MAITFKELIKVFGISTLLAAYITLIHTFMKAYLSPQKKIIVYINNFGEAWWEFALIVITFPCVLYFIYDFFLVKRCNNYNHKVW